MEAKNELMVLTVFKNTKLLSVEQLFRLLKPGLESTLLPSLMLSWPLCIRVNDGIDISIPEIIKGCVFSIAVRERTVELRDYGRESGYDTSVLETILQEFLNAACHR